MRLTKLEIRNYRLLVNADLNVDGKTTLIVGRNNTAKTSCMDFLTKIIRGQSISYDDYPLAIRKHSFVLLAKFLKGTLEYEKLLNKIPTPSLKFFIDYSLEEQKDLLGALSPFIIDVEDDVTSVEIIAEYKLKVDESEIRELFESLFSFDEFGKLTFNENDVRDTVKSNFSKLFSLVITALNPKNNEDKQVKSSNELKDLFPIYNISAERNLDETGENKESSLKAVINNFFKVDIKTLDPEVAINIQKLRETVEKANKEVQRKTNDILSNLINKTIGFGYPNADELELGVATNIGISGDLTDKSELNYYKKGLSETLPSKYNGLGYKNLIKIQFELAEFAERLKSESLACIPILFMEEPESHMHPQMQQTFAEYLEQFLEKISDVPIQVFLTSHSSHIANTVDFSKIRYAQNTIKGVIYKDLDTFSKAEPENIGFIKKYLTLSRCDLFFADKAIFVEGASERLLIPDMIDKCSESGLFDSKKYKLNAQYYTLIEIGGAYAHIFIPFMKFLGLPCLILTDIDSGIDGKTMSTVSAGKTTTNATIKWWVRKVKNIPKETKIKLKEDVIDLPDDQKSIDKIHIEYQVKEKDLCGRSLEEAIKNVNRTSYGLVEPLTEDGLKFDEKSKTEFALKLISDYPDYVIPQYIKSGLKWLNEQNVIV